MPLFAVPSLDALYTQLRAYVRDVVPLNLPVIRGLGNRVSSPRPSPGFVAMTATLQTPMSTPVQGWDRVNTNPFELGYRQGMAVRVQLDCYGPESGDWAVMLATTLRTDYACRLLAPIVSPLYADNPLQAPLIDAEAAYEARWIVGANLYYTPTVNVPMEFANAAEVTPINVDERYPP